MDVEEGSASVPNIPPIPKKDDENRDEKEAQKEEKPQDDFNGDAEELENNPDEVDE